LLGGGGTKAISDFATYSHNHTGTYALLAGSSGQNFNTSTLFAHGNVISYGGLRSYQYPSTSRGLLTENSSLIFGLSEGYAYGISTNAIGGLDIIANQGGVDMKFWVGGTPATPQLALTLAGDKSAIFASTVAATGYTAYGNVVYHAGNLTNTLSLGNLPYWNGSSLVNSTLWNSNSNIMVGLQRGDGAIGLFGQNYSMGYGFSTKFITLQSTVEQYGLTNDFGVGTSAQLSVVANGETANIGFYTGGAKGVANLRAYISPAGNFDIGYGGSRGEKLAVNGSTYFNGPSTINGALAISGAFSGATTMVASSYIQAAYYKLGNWEIKQNASGELEFILSGALKFKITATGVVSSGEVDFYS